MGQKLVFNPIIISLPLFSRKKNKNTSLSLTHVNGCQNGSHFEPSMPRFLGHKVWEPFFLIFWVALRREGGGEKKVPAAFDPRAAQKVRCEFESWLLMFHASIDATEGFFLSFLVLFFLFSVPAKWENEPTPIFRMTWGARDVLGGAKSFIWFASTKWRAKRKKSGTKSGNCARTSFRSRRFNLLADSQYASLWKFDLLLRFS